MEEPKFKSYFKDAIAYAKKVGLDYKENPETDDFLISFTDKKSFSYKGKVVKPSVINVWDSNGLDIPMLEIGKGRALTPRQQLMLINLCATAYEHYLDDYDAYDKQRN